MNQNTVFYTSEEKGFDVKPLLEEITSNSSPKEVANNLDETMNLLVQVSAGNDVDFCMQYIARLHHTLRSIRNAIQSGETL